MASIVVLIADRSHCSKGLSPTFSTLQDDWPGGRPGRTFDVTWVFVPHGYSRYNLYIEDLDTPLRGLAVRRTLTLTLRLPRGTSTPCEEWDYLYTRLSVDESGTFSGTAEVENHFCDLEGPGTEVSLFSRYEVSGLPLNTHAK